VSVVERGVVSLAVAPRTMQQMGPDLPAGSETSQSVILLKGIVLLTSPLSWKDMRQPLGWRSTT
jgi:hypothetical protein